MSKVVGDHLLCEADVLVFQHVYQGVTYVVAARVDDATLVDYRQLTGANATTVIINAFAALTGARTWKEKVTVKGNYTDLSRIIVPSNSTWEIQGKIQAIANLNQHFVYSNNTSNVEIFGGEIDANGANQTGDMDAIYFGGVTEGIIHHVRFGNAYRSTSNGEGVEFENCEGCVVSDCFCFTGNANGYDYIKVRGTSFNCLVADNVCRDTVQGLSDAIQVSGSAHDNIIIGNIIYAKQYGQGIKVHGSSSPYAHDNLIIGNHIYPKVAPLNYGIDILQTTNRNIVVGNHIYLASRGVEVRRVNASGDESYDNAFINNYIYLPSSGTNYGVDLDYNSLRTRVTGNIVIALPGGTNTGIRIQSGATGTHLEGGNDLSDVDIATKISDAGTGTIYPTLVLPFVDGTLFLSADGAPWGWEIDADTEYAITHGHLPLKVQQVVKWKIWAVALVAEADRMRLEIVGRGGGDNEVYTTESVDIANKASTSSNFAANDVIYWTLTASDDPDIDDFVGGDAIMIKVKHEAAGDGDCATDAAFLCVEIEYV